MGDIIFALGTFDMEVYIGIVHIFILGWQTYTAITMTSFMESPWLLDQDNARSRSACAITAWFHRHMWM